MDRRLIGIGAFGAILAIVVVVIVVSRGGDDDGSGESPISTDTSTKPTLTAAELPDGPPPTELVIEDIVEGDGATAEPGDQVSVQYVGVDYETGEEFDSSWGTGQPFQFQLGSGAVIQGWDDGVAGMKVGGRRELIIPPDLAYGAQGSPPTIGPNATLVFVVDLVSVP